MKELETAWENIVLFINLEVIWYYKNLAATMVE
jgi:hypothetical protein